MTRLTTIELHYLSKAFALDSGYVLDFSNTAFQHLILEACVKDIYADRYADLGNSKAKRLKSLWNKEPNECAGKTVIALVNYYNDKGLKSHEYLSVDSDTLDKARDIGLRLLGVIQEKGLALDDFARFLAQDIPEVPVSSLSLDQAVAATIESRIAEVKKCLTGKASLAVIMLCGSILEGLLLGVAQRDPTRFNTTASSPKDRDTGKVKRLHEWSLSDFINCGHELGYLGLEVKKHCHSLRDFRNYIHPNEQVVHRFEPDHHTAVIAWQVLKAAMSDIHELKNKLSSLSK